MKQQIKAYGIILTAYLITMCFSGCTNKLPAVASFVLVMAMWGGLPFLFKYGIERIESLCR